MSAPIPPVARCAETRAHYAHRWVRGEGTSTYVDCPGGPDETPEEPLLGHVRRAGWGEWEAICSAPRCGWRSSQGLKTKEAAEGRLRTHASIAHPPLLAVRAN